MAGAQHARLGPGGETIAAVSVFIDVEDQRRAVEETGRLAAIVEHSNDFIGFARPDWAVAYVNEAGRRLVGLPDLDAARRAAIADYFPPAEHGRVLAEILPAVERDGSGRARHDSAGSTTARRCPSSTISSPSGTPKAPCSAMER